MLDRAAAERALGDIDPQAVIDVVNAEMLRALRVVSVERGHDPRDFALVAFGGAGPLHACALAEELGIDAVLVPEAAGVLSALGLVAGDERRDRVVSYVRPLAEAGELPAEGEADLRYRGQSFELTVPLQPDLAGAFHRAHEERYGYADPEREIELVAVRTADVTPGPDVSLASNRPLQGRGACARRAVRRDVLGARRLERRDERRRHAGAAAMNVELQVIGSALRAVAEEMGAVLIRSAFSANIKERRDCSTAIFDEAGRMIAQAEHIPVHLGAMPDAVAAAMSLGLDAGRGLHPQRPVHGRHAPAGHDARLAHVARLRRLARAPRRRRRHGAGEPARVLARALPGRADHPADAAHATRSSGCSSRTRATPTSGAATCARRSPRTDSPSGASTSSARGADASASPRRWTSSTRTRSGWCARRSRGCPTARGRPRTSSKRSKAS